MILTQLNGKVTVKLTNFISPFKSRQVKFQQKTDLENEKMIFHKEKLNTIGTIYKKRILSFNILSLSTTVSRPV